MDLYRSSTPNMAQIAQVDLPTNSLIRQRHQNWRQLGIGIIFIITPLFLITIVPALVIAPSPPAWAPSFLRDWAFDIRLAIAPALLKLSSLRNTGGGYEVYFDNLGEQVSITNQEITLVGTLYTPPVATSGSQNRPAILLLHGSTPEGRRLGIYRLLGRKLAERGYVVLSEDQRGFGDSSDPPQVNNIDAFDWTGDLRAFIDYLTALDGVDPERIYLLGHSMGANQAISAGIEDDRVQKIIAIGPSRRVQERWTAEGEYFRRREMRYMRLPQPIPASVYLELWENTPFIDQYLPYFAQLDHKPILLIDGEREGNADRQFLQAICDAMSEPKPCYTLARADHYANIANFGPVVVYDPPVIEALVDEINLWLDDLPVPNP